MAHKLTPERVRELVARCLHTANELAHVPTATPTLPADAVRVEGLVNSFGFHPLRLRQSRYDVLELLAQLPPEFRAESAAGGQSFLLAASDSEGCQWGEQVDAEQLLCLGIGLGLAKWLMPRKYWAIFPGGVPYVALALGLPALPPKDAATDPPP